MSERFVVEQDAFDELCSHIRAAGLVAFDTEFVSENTYRPELCLLQIATRERCVAVDPFRVSDLSAWWDLMTDDSTTVVVHAGREEARFCRTISGKLPRRLVDIQIAEGLRSRSYPLSYDRLVTRVVGRPVLGKETRTDWKRRPLSERQIAYALEDVRHVLDVWDDQQKGLGKLGRLPWAEAEFQRLLDELEAERGRDNWRRISGIHRLQRRELAVARELYYWREQTAEARNQPARRILRDDLLMDLARRRPESASEVLATRDMNRPQFKRSADDIAAAVARGLEIPESKLPKRSPSPSADPGGDEHVISQLLGIALSNRCAELEVSKSLVGTSNDLRDFVRWTLEANRKGDPPRLAAGWRAEVCGDLLSEMLDGKISLRVADPESDHPLVFERRS